MATQLVGELVEARKQVVSAQHSATGGRHVTRARSCPECGAGSQWHGRKCSCQEIDMFWCFVFFLKAPFLNRREGP